MSLTKQMWRIGALVVAGMVILVGSGCASSGGGSNAEVTLDSVMNRDLLPKTRKAHLRRLWELETTGVASHDEVRERLKRVAWLRSEWWEVRMVAIESLLQDTPNLDDTANMLRLLLPTEPSPQLTMFIGDLAAEYQWTELAPSFVRRWSRFDPHAVDDERVEYRSLRKLFPDRPVEDVVFDVFMDTELAEPSVSDDEVRRRRQRDDAWALLRRLDTDGSRTITLLQGTAADPGDEVLRQLRAAASTLGIVPDTRAEMEWLRRLMRPEWAGYREQAASIVAGLSPEQRRGLRLRHLPSLVHASRYAPDRLAMSRDVLVERIDDMVTSRRRHARSRGASGEMISDEDIDRFRDRVAWADLIAIFGAAVLVDDPALAAGIFAQAERDRTDESTEHGGIINYGPGGSLEIQYYAPRIRQRLGDRQFTASPEMILASDESAFHYHLHAQEYDNGDYAGPSHQDELYATEQGRCCLVFTFVKRDAMNVDYYQPGGVVVDLGEVHRPESR